MSYDLFFRSRPGATPINADTFRDYFQPRRNVQMQGNRASYGNQDTGVYFSFELEADGSQDDAERSDASFNLNYYRPHIFGLEAEGEVAGFVATFNPLIADDQINGMGDGVYTGEAFLKGWNTGNRLGYEAFASQPRAQKPQLLTTSEIERTWRWNAGRQSRQQRAGDSVFVPKISFLLRPAGVMSFVTWPDAIPVNLPEVDLVMVAREEFAPWRFFGRRLDVVMVEWADLLSLIAPFQKEEDGTVYYAMNYRKPPENLVSWVKQQSGQPLKKEAIAVDQILNQEIWDEEAGSLRAVL